MCCMASSEVATHFNREQAAHEAIGQTNRDDGEALNILVKLPSVILANENPVARQLAKGIANLKAGHFAELQKELLAPVPKVLARLLRQK